MYTTLFEKLSRKIPNENVEASVVYVHMLSIKKQGVLQTMLRAIK